MAKQKLHPAEKATEVAMFVSNAIGAAGIASVVCGSLRRKLERVHDVDLVVLGDLTDATEAIIQESDLCSVSLDVKENKSVDKKIQHVVVRGIQVDLFKVNRESLGAMILFLTGNKMFNILMRSRAKRMGYKLSQYGLYHGEEIIAGRSECQIFEALDMRFVEPIGRSMSPGDRFDTLT